MQPDDELGEVEQRILQAFCHGSIGGRVALDTLRAYHWRAPIHRAIFDVLVNMPGAGPELIREQLPAGLTRRGFPDFDLTWLQPHALTDQEIKRLIDRLRQDCGE